MTGAKISEMTVVDIADVPATALFPFVVPAAAGGLSPTLNYTTDVITGLRRDMISVFDYMSEAEIEAVQGNDYSTITAAQITTACQDAITAAAGGFVYFPAGTYRISSTLSYNADATFGAFAPGIKIVGDGIAKTYFDNRVANAPMIDIDALNHGSPFEASMGAVLREFTIINVSSPANSIGIRILNGFEVEIDHLYIKGMTAYGIEMKNGSDPDDGWNMVAITNCWIDNCAIWGIKADGSAGRNEGSLTYLRHVFFQGNGTSSASTPPPSGGMIWKGQILVMESSGFANGTENVGLYVKGDTGLAQSVDLRSVSFENCKKRGLYVTGCHVVKGRNIQFYNNDAFTATVQCEFDGTTYAINQVDLDGVSIRATSGNSSITAFKFQGANAQLNNMRVRNVNWENFDFAGQTRFNGVQFDQVPQNCLIADSGAATSVLLGSFDGKGNTTPIRLRGPNNDGGVGVASTSGEWVPLQLSSSLVLASAGLTPNTTYYVYLYDNAGVPTLEASATIYVKDSASGYNVKTGDATKLFVGRVRTNATVGGEFEQTNIGWVNPGSFPGTQSGANGWTWRDTATAPDRIYYKDSTTLPSSVSDGQYVELL